MCFGWALDGFGLTDLSAVIAWIGRSRFCKDPSLGLEDDGGVQQNFLAARAGLLREVFVGEIEDRTKMLGGECENSQEEGSSGSAGPRRRKEVSKWMVHPGGVPL